MWPKRIILLTVILALVAVVFSQQKTATNLPTSGFQLVAAPITVSSSGKTWEEHRVFLVDSSSGSVWEYLPERIDKEQTFHAASFSPIPIKK